MAHINSRVEEYVEKKVQSALIMAIGFSILSFFVLSKLQKPTVIVLLLFVVYFVFFLTIFMKSVDAQINRRAKDIDREVLFAGRFLLIKLNAGQPLINALVDASNSYGVASKFFKEMVRDIDIGTPVEEALENAQRNTGSKKFRSILFQISTALKIGVDVSKFLGATLEDIANEQLVEIQRYGKKLNGVTMFYMLLSIVVPSLGLTLFILVASLVSIDVNFTLFSILAFLLVIIGFIFLTVFKSIRPNVNI